MAADYDYAARQPGRARAKINLSLHVRGRRADGYHELESLVAFAGVSDALSFLPNEQDHFTLTVDGVHDLGPVNENLVIRAARATRSSQGGHFRLVKNLPIASGMGGGSADAAAALRLLLGTKAHHINAAVIGADVPVCIASRARMMRGVGEALGPILALPPLPAVLVNPRIAVATADVFRALALQKGEQTEHAPHPECGDDVFALLAATRNDLEAPAISVAPIIADVLAVLRDQPHLRVARMSGSGATCFGIFEHRRAASQAARALKARYPHWWIRTTLLR